MTTHSGQGVDGSGGVDPGQPLGQIVTDLPGSARVLERHGLDYCCGGGASLADACAEAGVDASEVVAELEGLQPAPAPDWATMGPSELVDHVVAQHHVHLREELPRLSALATKVASVHGDRHPELAEVRQTFELVKADLIPHMVKEERVLFPAVKELESAATMPWFPFGSTAGPISIMLREHDTVGELLERLRQLTGGYRPPADGCASYAALYEGLEELERDTHLHVHKENNLLFPAVERLEQQLSRVAATG